MALPTVAQLKARHPAFASVSDSYIDAVISDASGFIGESEWLERDYQPAIMALACHMMATEGALGGRADTSGALTSDKLGDAAQTYATITGGSTDFTTTSFGRQYLRLLRVNIPAVATT